MGEYTKDLPNMHPHTGRYIKEDGTTANLANCISTDGSGNPAIRILLNGGNAILDNLTINSDLTVNGNFNFGDVGTDILTIAGYIRGTLTGMKYVSIGNTATSHTLNAINDFMIGGRLEVDGIAYFDSNILLADGTVSLPALAFINDPADGFYRIGSHNIGLAINGVKLIDWSTTAQTITGNSLGATNVVPGLNFINNTAATLTVQQQAPTISIISQGWKTAATAGSQPVEWQIVNLPIQGINSPTSQLRFYHRTDNGSWVNPVYFSSDGSSNFAGSLTISATGSGGFYSLSTSDAVCAIRGVGNAQLDIASNYLAGAGTDKDSMIRFYVNEYANPSWTIGVDNSDSDIFKISSATYLPGTNDRFSITATGNVGIRIAPHTSANYALNLGAGINMVNEDGITWLSGNAYIGESAYGLTFSTYNGSTMNQKLFINGGTTSANSMTFVGSPLPSFIVKGSIAVSYPTIGVTTSNDFAVEGFKFNYNGNTGNTYFDNYYATGPAGTGSMIFRVNVASTPLQMLKLNKDTTIEFGVGSFLNSGGTFYQKRGYVTTTNATPTAITDAKIVLANNLVMTVEYEVLGKKSDSTQVAGYRVSGLIRNVSGVLTLVSSSVQVLGEDDASWDCILEVSGSDTQIKVTGEATTTISWVAYGKYWAN